uniref:GP-PDE domain-containing protein n=1 Tax=viral metagenome TaxID=1070528 RepID=A0A6C0BTZ8_9ZZZZ
MNNIIEIAHRGNSHYYKDNSIQSFTSALDEKFDMIELDIQLCRSGEIVVNHDLFIDYNFIKNMDLNEIQEIDSDIITLKQFFEIPRMKDIDVYLDLKGDIKIAKEVVKFINVNNLNKDRILIGSFNLKHLDIIHTLDISIKLGFITDNNLSDALYFELSKLNYLYFIAVSWNMLDIDTISLLKLQGIKLFVFTCANELILSHILNYQVDGIISNFKIVTNS